LVLLGSMRVYPENKGMGKKRKKHRKAHPPESPLNGGIYCNSPPWRGAVYGEEGAFIFFQFILRKG
jgi:hypothetical protein